MSDKEYAAQLVREWRAARRGAWGDGRKTLTFKEFVAGIISELREARTPLPTVDDERCETCKFWFRKDSESGDCRRYPPTSRDAVPMDYEDWCGEWRSCGPKGGAA